MGSMYMKLEEFLGQIFKRETAVWTYILLNMRSWKYGDPSKYVVSFYKKQNLKLLIARLAPPARQKGYFFVFLLLWAVPLLF
jgi:hypothetical protein